MQYAESCIVLLSLYVCLSLPTQRLYSLGVYVHVVFNTLLKVFFIFSVLMLFTFFKDFQ